MWKDYFYFSRGQRIGIIVLIVLIVIALTANYTLKYFFPVTEKDGTAFLTEVAAFKKSLVSRDSILKEQRKRQYEERYKKYKPFPPYQKKITYSLFAFDPNLADSATFVRLGLKPFMASNILKYRSKGGWFKTTADFGKVYGLAPEKYCELEPYIAIHEKKLTKTDSLYIKQKELKKELIVELNSADTTLLMQVIGIGRGYAKGIVRFRQQTGGFVSVNQLSEIYGISPESLEKIRPFCKVNAELVRKIKINVVSVERLKSHPYLNFYQSRAIYELRRKKGKLKNINELKNLPEFTPDGLAKIEPYLSFE
ncbi:MAG: helix-hairpin-helix domain-containing protein [Paludibacter sp.]|nr:helix-hairpin-helix domain-containing protein [Paludibacter sp.]